MHYIWSSCAIAKASSKKSKRAASIFKLFQEFLMFLKVFNEYFRQIVRERERKSECDSLSKTRSGIEKNNSTDHMQLMGCFQFCIPTACLNAILGPLRALIVLNWKQFLDSIAYLWAELLKTWLNRLICSGRLGGETNTQKTINFNSATI